MRGVAVLGAVLALAGCPYDPENTDTDGDGVADANDCAIEDPERSPAQPDAYGDGVDQNCDGVDGNDVDGDGYPGDAPEGDPERDCDDRDPALSPADADGDGWSTCAGDCADDDRIRHPNAWEDEFDDLDDDCNGVDAGAIATATWATFTGLPGEKAGESLANVGDVDGDGVPDLGVGAPFAGEDGSEVGRAYILFGSTLAAGGAVSADVTLDGAAEADRFGSWIAGAGDVDGDGKADVLVGAPRSDLNGFGSGAVYLFYGASLTAGSTWQASDADAVFAAQNWGDDLSVAAAAGDVDGDGLDDILLGAPLNDARAPDAGRAFLFLGATLAAGPTNDGGESEGPCARRGGFSVCDADLVIEGEHAEDLAGSSVASAGDLDGDGLGDFLIGVPGSDFNTSTGGIVGVFFGADVGALLTAGTRTVGLPDASLYLVGAAFDARAGETLSAGDIDGDGVLDIFAGGCRPRTGQQAGSSFLHVWSGASVAAGPEAVALLARFERDPDSGAGFCAGAPIGDIDGDGVGDLALGDHLASRVDPEGAGALSVFLGASLDAGALPTVLDADYGFWGEGRDEHGGWGVVGAGDLNGDGADDIAISAVRAGDNGGRVSVLLSPAP